MPSYLTAEFFVAFTILASVSLIFFFVVNKNIQHINSSLISLFGEENKDLFETKSIFVLKIIYLLSIFALIGLFLYLFLTF